MVTTKGWQSDTTKATRLQDLPAAAKAYLKYIEKYTGVPVAIVSVGAERERTIVVEPKLKTWKF